MSNFLFPKNLTGYQWDGTKKPVFNNVTHAPTNGRDVTLSLYSQPVYEFVLHNGWLTKADKNTLINFFISRGGSFDSFLYDDEDSAISHSVFAVGDGVMTDFQLTKVTNLAIETVNNCAANPSIYLDDVLQTGCTVSGSGLVTMAVAPAIGAVLSWSGTAYYRCVFADDNLEYNQFANLLYDCDTITFKGSMATKL
jgi:hypothetical protein